VNVEICYYLSDVTLWVRHGVVFINVYRIVRVIHIYVDYILHHCLAQFTSFSNKVKLIRYFEGGLKMLIRSFVHRSDCFVDQSLQ